jgi:hypothetical protein
MVDRRILPATIACGLGRAPASADDGTSERRQHGRCLVSRGRIALAHRLGREEDPIHGQGLEVPPPLP